MTAASVNIWDLIRDLLHHHDCVIIPGFGGFVCNREPARIDQVSHLITPPAKRIVFNQNLRTNDGLLAGSLAAAANIQYNAALEMIGTEADKLRDILQEKKQHVITQFGTFRLNADANYVFLPDRNNNFLPSSFGLVPLQALPVAGRTVKGPKARTFRDRKEVRRSKGRFRVPRALFIGSFLLVLLSVNGYIFYDKFTTPAPYAEVKPAPITEAPVVNEQPETTSQASVIDLNAFSEHIGETRHVLPSSGLPMTEPAVTESPTETNAPVAETVVAPESALSAFARSISGVRHSLPATAPSPDPVPAAEEAAPGVSPRTERISDSTFYVIGGVFCKERNARKYFHELEAKGYQPVLVENSRIHCNRVSYAAFTTRSQANAFLAKIHATENPNAWLLCEHR